MYDRYFEIVGIYCLTRSGLLNPSDKDEVGLGKGHKSFGQEGIFLYLWYEEIFYVPNLVQEGVIITIVIEGECL